MERFIQSSASLLSNLNLTGDLRLEEKNEELFWVFFVIKKKIDRTLEFLEFEYLHLNHLEIDELEVDRS